MRTGSRCWDLVRCNRSSADPAQVNRPAATPSHRTKIPEILRAALARLCYPKTAIFEPRQIARASVLPFFAPLPRNTQLASLCIAFLHRPLVHAPLSEWAEKLHQSERTFSRFFRAETGMAFSEWRQQACLISALSMLAKGKPVTAVALELGNESPGAFSAMFRKRLACPPSEFVR